MEVFISWSGKRSRAMAETLRDWLPTVIQALQPWISPDIGKGQRWGGELATQLENARAGILCLTSENLMEPWLLFEGGAISKMKESRTCTFLLDLKPTDVEPPLGQFQATVFEKGDVHKLVRDLNADLEKTGERPLKDNVLNNGFELCWPQLEGALQAIQKQGPGAAAPGRGDSDKLDEALGLLRGMSRRFAEQDASDANKQIVDALLAQRRDMSPSVSLANLSRVFFDNSGTTGTPLPLKESTRAAAAGLGKLEGHATLSSAKRSTSDDHGRE